MKILIPGLIIFTAWCVISIRWYVCGIYELCAEQNTINDVEEMPSSTLADEVLTESYQAPLAFEWSSAEPITNDKFNNFRDSLSNVFNQSPAAVVEITGLYDPQELNNTDFDNLGLARAESIKQLLLNSGIKRSFSVESAPDDLSSGLSGNINQAYLFELTSRELRTATGFIISEAKNKLVIHFPSNSAQPESDQQVKLALSNFAERTRNEPSKLLVVGHTDSQGDSLENKKLGLIRASKVKDLLIINGVKESAVLVESAGEEEPLVTNNTPQGRHQNRRVEIVII